MELPDFSCLWEAESALTKLKESLEEDNIKNQRQYRNPHLGGRGGPVRPHPRRTRPQYVSDGICGVNFGIVEPEFANPLATCCYMLFFTNEEYDRHISEHVRCPGLADVDNGSCGRDIHPSAVKVHLELEHRAKADESDSATSDKLLKAWREARAKNYPTFERVQAKIREVGYRMERGQVFLTRKFGSLNKRSPQELRPIPEETIKRFKPVTEEDEVVTSQDKNTKDDAYGAVQEDADPRESEQIDENEKVFSDNEEGEGKSDAEPNEPSEEAMAESDKESEQNMAKNVQEKELLISDDEVSEIEDAEVPQNAQLNSPANIPNYHSDCIWSEKPKEGERLEEELESRSIANQKCRPDPIINYDSDVSWNEEIEDEDAGDAQVQPRFSPPKELNLIDQLGFFKPQNLGEEYKVNESNEITKDDKADSNEDCGFGNRRRRRRQRFHQMRRGRRTRPAASIGRLDKSGDSKEEDNEYMQRPPTAVEAELDLELDEVSSKRGQRAFLNHPVVEMATKRRLCMRRTSTITKRPTLLHMLLAEEIRHERNQLMQCVRFVVKNNFFLPK